MIICADARRIPLADESVQCVVTSPSYWGLRKYAGNQELIWCWRDDCEHEWESAGVSTQRNRMNAPGTTLRGGNVRTGEAWAEGAAMLHPKQGDFCKKCAAWRGAFGLEPSVEMYIAHTVEILREIRRVLHNDGVCFWNIADSYSSGGRVGHGTRTGYKQETNRGTPKDAWRPPCNEVKPKDLCLIPQRAALAAQADVSTNVSPGNFGTRFIEPRDPGVAVYFSRPPAEDDFSWQEVLGISVPDPSLDVIEKAYRDKARQTHPDMGGEDVELFKQVNEAKKRAVAWVTGDYGREHEMVIECDKYKEIRLNMKAIAVALHSLRRIEDCGASSLLERAFKGFEAITEKASVASS